MQYSTGLANFQNSVKFAKTTNESTFKSAGMRSVLNSRSYMFNMIGEVQKDGSGKQKAYKRLFPSVEETLKPGSSLRKFINEKEPTIRAARDTVPDES
jgi:hypothetical protein